MSLNKIVVAIALLALLVYTNPTIEAYGNFVRQEIVQRTGDHNDLTSILASFFGGILGSAITSTTTRTDFIFFSIYNTALGTENTKVIGILNNFFFISPLKSVQANSSSSLANKIDSSSDQNTQPLEYEDKFNTREILRCMQEFNKEKQGFKKETLSDLKTWAGRYPTKSFGNEEKQNFFTVPQVKHRLLEILSRKDFEDVTIEYGTESPIELIDDYLLISRCKPHSCPENVLIALSLLDGSIFTMFSNPHSENPHLFGKRCFAKTNGDLKLPTSIQERFLSKN